MAWNSEELQEKRRLMARLAGSKYARTTQFTSEIPVKWSPIKIENPATGLAFTEASAWRLIEQLLLDDTLKEGAKLRQTVLEKPPGVRALELLHDVDGAGPFIYIKVHLWKGKVYGRSFHSSTKGRETW